MAYVDPHATNRFHGIAVLVLFFTPLAHETTLARLVGCMRLAWPAADLALLSSISNREEQQCLTNFLSWNLGASFI